jgi:hypothetical protein
MKGLIILGAVIAVGLSLGIIALAITLNPGLATTSPGAPGSPGHSSTTRTTSGCTTRLGNLVPLDQFGKNQTYTVHLRGNGPFNMTSVWCGP